MEKLILNFKKLQINNIKGACDNYLEIRAGNSYNSPLIEKICHSNGSKIIKTGSSRLFIRLFSESNDSLVEGTYDAGILISFNYCFVFQF